MHTCKSCGEEFEEDDVVKVGKKYVCYNCCEEDTWWWCKLYEKLKEINNVKDLNIRQITVLKKMSKDDKLKFSIMYYTLCYLQLIGKTASEEYDLIGLIKYYYDEAKKFYEKKWDIEDSTEINDIKQKIIKTKLVAEKYKKKEDLGFDFLNEEE